MKISLLLCLLCCCALASLLPLTTARADAPTPPATKPAKKIQPALLPITDDPTLPRVLLIGDSISMGYTLPTRALLHNRANVHHPPVNCGPTTRGLKEIDEWLGEKRWDVIHFNFGLHDLKYVDAKGGMTSTDKGTQLVPLPEYEANLRALVARLKKSGARLIWADTTPVPAASGGRIEGSERAYNETAARVMRENGIPTNDLHAVIVANPTSQRPKNVHFTPEGYDELAHAVAAAIEAAL